MFYQSNLNAGAKSHYVEPRSGSKFPYLTVKEMRELYPEGNFAIVGEIGGLSRPTDGGDVLIVDGVRLIPILPRGSLKKPFEWVTGYIPVEGSLYIAAVCGVCRITLCRRK